MCLPTSISVSKIPDRSHALIGYFCHKRQTKKIKLGLLEVWLVVSTWVSNFQPIEIWYVLSVTNEHGGINFPSMHKIPIFSYSFIDFDVFSLLEKSIISDISFKLLSPKGFPPWMNKWHLSPIVHHHSVWNAMQFSLRICCQKLATSYTP